MDGTQYKVLSLSPESRGFSCTIQGIENMGAVQCIKGKGIQYCSLGAIGQRYRNASTNISITKPRIEKKRERFDSIWNFFIQIVAKRSDLVQKFICQCPESFDVASKQTF